MVQEDILGGLSSALARGQSLRQSMMSFYNAGYKKEDIEEAARVLKSEQLQETNEVAPKPRVNPAVIRTRPTTGNFEIQQNKESVQKISYYGDSDRDYQGSEKQRQVQAQQIQQQGGPVPVQIISSYA